jgi:hypothetical protein
MSRDYRATVQVYRGQPVASCIILGRVWNYPSPLPLTARSLGGGSTMGARRWTADYGSTLIRGLVVGDLLWVVVIAFLFAVITGVLG